MGQGKAIQSLEIGRPPTHVVHSPAGLVYILVDYDNIPPLLSRSGPRFLADRLQDRLLLADPSLAVGDLRLDFRFYGGWRGSATQSRRAVDLIAQLARDFPAIVFDRKRGRKLTLNGTLAESLLVLPHQVLPHTFRVRSDPPRLQCADSVTLGCTIASCPTLVLRPLFVNRACPESGCSRGLEEMVTRAEQKLVDTMLVCDAIHLAQLGETSLSVVSSDDDLWPGMLSAMSLGTRVVHITTKYSSTSATYLGSMGSRYLTRSI